MNIISFVGYIFSILRFKLICDQFCKEIFRLYFVHVYFYWPAYAISVRIAYCAALSFHQPWHCPHANSVGSVKIPCLHRFAKFIWKLSCRPYQDVTYSIFHLPVYLRQDGPLQWQIERRFWWGGGGGGGSLLPPLRQNHLIFIENFLKKQENWLINNHVILTNRTAFVNLNPLSRNPGSAPALIYFGHHRYDNSPKLMYFFSRRFILLKQSDHRGLPLTYFLCFRDQGVHIVTP